MYKYPFQFFPALRIIMHLGGELCSLCAHVCNHGPNVADDGGEHENPHQEVESDEEELGLLDRLAEGVAAVQYRRPRQTWSPR